MLVEVWIICERAYRSGYESDTILLAVLGNISSRNVHLENSLLVISCSLGMFSAVWFVKAVLLNNVY